MDLNRFVIDLIHKKNYKWMEERRLEFVPLLSTFLNNFLTPKSILIVTDEKRKWYSEYLINKINSFNTLQPQFYPFYILENIVPQIRYTKSEEDFDKIEDMLNVSFEEYIFWYIGVESDFFQFSKRKPDSFFWTMDSDFSNNFFLKSLDPYLDNKLIHLADIVVESINAAVFEEIKL